MKMAFKSNTIRRRIRIVFFAIILFMGVLTAGYTWNIYILKSDLVTIEDFYTLSNNVLELRRFEKNFIFDLGSDRYNFNQIMHYLDTIENDTDRLDESVSATVGKTEFLCFRRDLLNYHATIAKKSLTNEQNVAEIRTLGKAMVDFTTNLVLLKQKKINDALHKTLIVFLAATGGGFTIVFYVFIVQTQRALRRLATIQRGTEGVIHGNWVPIPDDISKKDEISDLIYAFNKMAEELEIKQDQLLQSEKLAAIGTFSSGIAHELNNPLNNISLTTDTLEEEYNTLPEEEAREMISDIAMQTERASSVVRNLLDFCRDRSPSIQDEIHIKNVVDGTTNLIKNQLRMESISLETTIPETLPLVKGDFKQLQQVFLNLFLNAIFSISGSGLIVVEAQETREGHIRVDFSDTGCGIPAEELKNVFDPFFTTKPVGQGTGLGLSIVHTIIWKHGGYIEVSSKVGGGTTFSIFLPISRGNQE